MKISEMTTNAAADALIRIAEPFKNICEDEDTLKILDKMKNFKGDAPIKAFGSIIPEIVIFSLKKHRADLYEVIGALCQKSAKQVAEMNIKETIAVARDSYDDVLKDFFTSFASQTTADAT